MELEEFRNEIETIFDKKVSIFENNGLIEIKIYDKDYYIEHFFLLEQGSTCSNVKYINKISKKERHKDVCEVEWYTKKIKDFLELKHKYRLNALKNKKEDKNGEEIY